MSIYKKPKCDCGAFLKAYRNEVWAVTRSITSDGELSDRIIKIKTGFDDCDYEAQLYCSKCGRSYQSDYDECDRIIRGELLD